MFRRGPLVCAAAWAALLPLAERAGAADTPSAEAKPGWFQRMAGPAPKPVTPPKPLPHPAEVAATQQSQEMASYLRRAAVCDRIRQIAMESGDDALMKQADALDKQAFNVYQQRVSNLPCSRVKSDETPAAPAAPAAKGEGQ